LANLLTNDFFYSAKLGFEFEFYSNLNRNEIADSLGKTLGKKILLFSKYHSGFKPTKDIFEPVYLVSKWKVRYRQDRYNPLTNLI
jgi:hypothetical protein